MDHEMTARLEQYVAEMSDAEFSGLVARTRPPTPPADDAAAIRAAEARKDWSTAFDLKKRRLGRLISDPNPNR